MALSSPYITSALVFCVVLLGLFLVQKYQVREGFQDKSQEERYQAIRNSMAKLKPFEDLQRDIKQTLLEGIREAKQPEDPTETLRRTYIDNLGEEPLDTTDLFNLPPWSTDTEDISLALGGIPDTLDTQIQKELNFYKKKLDELNQVFSNLKDPSTFKVPEGFADQGKCSAESSRLAREALRQKRLIEQQKADAAKYPPKKSPQPSDCVVRPLPLELSRVEAILARINLNSLASEIRQVSGGITKFRQDFQKLKDGTLFEWQQAGPKKSYATFQGKSNADGLLFSIQQAGS